MAEDVEKLWGQRGGGGSEQLGLDERYEHLEMQHEGHRAYVTRWQTQTPNGCSSDTNQASPAPEAETSNEDTAFVQAAFVTRVERL